MCDIHGALMGVPMGEIIFSYNNCFKAMEEARIIDMDDPFMRESFTTMYFSYTRRCGR
jgi:hypothetical protein